MHQTRTQNDEVVRIVGNDSLHGVTFVECHLNVHRHIQSPASRTNTTITTRPSFSQVRRRCSLSTHFDRVGRYVEATDVGTVDLKLVLCTPMTGHQFFFSTFARWIAMPPVPEPISRTLSPSFGLSRGAIS